MDSIDRAHMLIYYCVDRAHMLVIGSVIVLICISVEVMI